jgi:hypothetical protein
MSPKAVKPIYKSLKLNTTFRIAQQSLFSIFFDGSSDDEVIVISSSPDKEDIKYVYKGSGLSYPGD